MTLYSNSDEPWFKRTHVGKFSGNKVFKFFHLYASTAKLTDEHMEKGLQCLPKEKIISWKRMHKDPINNDMYISFSSVVMNTEKDNRKALKHQIFRNITRFYGKYSRNSSQSTVRT